MSTDDAIAMFWAFPPDPVPDPSETAELERLIGEVAPGHEVRWRPDTSDFGIGGSGEWVEEVLQVWVPTTLASATSVSMLAGKIGRWIKSRRKSPQTRQSIIIYGPDGNILKQFDIE